MLSGRKLKKKKYHHRSQKRFRWIRTADPCSLIIFLIKLQNSYLCQFWLKHLRMKTHLSWPQFVGGEHSSTYCFSLREEKWGKTFLLHISFARIHVRTTTTRASRFYFRTASRKKIFETFLFPLADDFFSPFCLFLWFRTWEKCVCVN